MNKIVNHNCNGLCCQQFCDNPETHFTILEVYNVSCVIGFCENHSIQFDTYRLNSIIKGGFSK